MTTTNQIRNTTAPYEYLQEYQSIEDEFKEAPSSKYVDIYNKIQNLTTRIANDLHNIETNENSFSTTKVVSHLNSDYSELYKSMTAKLAIMVVCLVLVLISILHYIWTMFASPKV